MKSKTLIFYKSFFCPFCPEAERRIEALRKEHDFEVKEVNVTWRPDILIQKGIKAVPTVEVDGQVVVGLPTTRQLKELLGIAVGWPDSASDRELARAIRKEWMGGCPPWMDPELHRAAPPRPMSWRRSPAKCRIRPR